MCCLLFFAGRWRGRDVRTFGGGDGFVALKRFGSQRATGPLPMFSCCEVESTLQYSSGIARTE